jgi:hypothetical protein
VRREKYRGGGVFHFDERSARFCEGGDEPVVLQAVGIDFAYKEKGKKSGGDFGGFFPVQLGEG